MICDPHLPPPPDDAPPTLTGIVQAMEEFEWPPRVEERHVIHKSDRLLWLWFQTAILKEDRHAIEVIRGVARRRGLPWANLDLCRWRCT